MARRVKKGLQREISLPLTSILLLPDLAANRKGARGMAALPGLIYRLLTRSEMSHLKINSAAFAARRMIHCRRQRIQRLLRSRSKLMFA